LKKPLMLIVNLMSWIWKLMGLDVTKKSIV